MFSRGMRWFMSDKLDQRSMLDAMGRAMALYFLMTSDDGFGK